MTMTPRRLINSDKVRIRKKLWSRSKIDPITNCWLWYGHRSGGYGRLTIFKYKYLAHVLSMWIHKDIYPNSQNYICHIRECTNKNCWNPDHLYNGTGKSNVQDSVAIGTHHLAIKTHCPKGHLLDDYFRDRDRDKVHRYCRICRVDRVRAWRERRKAEGKSAK